MADNEDEFTFGTAQDAGASEQQNGNAQEDANAEQDSQGLDNDAPAASASQGDINGGDVAAERSRSSATPSQQASETQLASNDAASASLEPGASKSSLSDAPTQSQTLLQQLSRQSTNQRSQSNSEAGSNSARTATEGAPAATEESSPATADAPANGSAAGSVQGEQQPAAASAPGETSGPRYQQPTHVLPKGMHQDYSLAAKEHVQSVFSTGTALPRGIRSLPDALGPDFRAALYQEIVDTARLERTGQALPGSRPPFKPLAAEGGITGPVAPGQKPVTRVHPLAGSFATYEYLPSEYDRQRLITKFERLRNKLAQVTPAEFVVKAMPSAPKCAPAFSEFEYSLNPYDGPANAVRARDAMDKARVLSGPFFAGGKVQPATTLQGYADECMLALCKVLSDDWPTSFLQIFEDRTGSIVASFDKPLALSEGDLPAYMANLCKNNLVISEYSLTKDATQWGIVDTETQSVFYVLWPPWVRHRYMGPPAEAVAAEASTVTAAAVAVS